MLSGPRRLLREHGVRKGAGVGLRGQEAGGGVGWEERKWARKTVTEKLTERPVSEPAEGGWL